MQKSMMSIIVMIFIIATLLSFAISIYTISHNQETIDKAKMYDFYKPQIDKITSCKTIPMVICT